MGKGNRKGMWLSALEYKDGERTQRERDGHKATLA